MGTPVHRVSIQAYAPSSFLLPSSLPMHQHRGALLLFVCRIICWASIKPFSIGLGASKTPGCNIEVHSIQYICWNICPQWEGWLTSMQRHRHGGQTKENVRMRLRAVFFLSFFFLNQSQSSASLWSPPPDCNVFLWFMAHYSCIKALQYHYCRHILS